MNLLKRLSRMIADDGRVGLEITPIRREQCWLTAALPFVVGAGDLDLSSVDARTRSPVDPAIGAFHAWLVRERRPELVVGSAAGDGLVGMYILAGMRAARRGHFQTYEPDVSRAVQVRENLASVSDAFTLVAAPFRDAAAGTLRPGSVDVALIDPPGAAGAIALTRSYEVLRPYLRDGAIVIFSGIEGSRANRRYWKLMARRAEFAAAAEIAGRLGIVQLRGQAPPAPAS